MTCHHASVRRRCALCTRRPRAFTLIELLVVIGIIGLLISILLPSLHRAREQANATRCASSLRQIGNAVQIYANQNKGFLASWTNNSRWSPPGSPNEIIDENYVNPTTLQVDVYWGVRYAVAGGLPKRLFNCPSEQRRNSVDPDTDPAFVHYGLNGYGMDLTAREREARFGQRLECALFRDVKGNWVGRPLSGIRNPSRTIFAQDAGEVTIDGNGDTFDDWYQHTPPNVPVDRAPEWLRHNKAANVLFVDAHVERFTREQQADMRYYTGRW